MSPSWVPAATAEQADRVVALLRRRELTVAIAESLTGGLLTATVTSVPGSSDVLLGGIVSYATSAKAQLLGVDQQLLATATPVDPGVAEQMALGACRAFGAEVGVATTGEAGPESASGKPVGTVYLVVHDRWGSSVRSLHLTGERPEIVAATVHEALELLADRLGDGLAEGGSAGDRLAEDAD